MTPLASVAMQEKLRWLKMAFAGPRPGGELPRPEAFVDDIARGDKVDHAAAAIANWIHEKSIQTRASPATRTGRCNGRLTSRAPSHRGAQLLPHRLGITHQKVLVEWFAEDVFGGYPGGDESGTIGFNQDPSGVMSPRNELGPRPSITVAQLLARCRAGPLRSACVRDIRESFPVFCHGHLCGDDVSVEREPSLRRNSHSRDKQEFPIIILTRGDVLDFFFSHNLRRGLPE